MDFAFSSDRVVDWAFNIGVGLVCLTGLLCILIFFLRGVLILQKRRQQKVIQFWAPVFEQCLKNEFPSKFGALQRHEINPFLSLWLNYQEISDGNIQEILNLVALQAGLHRFLYHHANRGSIREKLLAFTALGFLKDREALPILREAVTSPNTFLSLAAARSLLMIDGAGSIALVVDSLMTRTDWPPSRVTVMLIECGIDLFSPPLAKRLLTRPPDKIPLYVHYLGIAQTQIALKTLHHLLTRYTEVPLILACLDVLGKFAGFEDIPLIRRYLEHPHWPVRASAVRLLGKFGEREDYPQLLHRLNDEEPYVRFVTAKALSQQPMFERQIRRLTSDDQSSLSFVPQESFDLLKRLMAEQTLSRL